MIKNKLKRLAWIFLTGTLALGNFACSSPDYTIEIEKISKRTGYSEDKIYDMIGKTLDRMMSISDQPQAIVKRQNYEIKAEIGKKMFCSLADKFGNEDYMTSNDEFDSLCIVLSSPEVYTRFENLFDKYLGNNDGKFDEEECKKINEKFNDQKDNNKRFHGLTRYFPGLMVLEEGKLY